MNTVRCCATAAGIALAASGPAAGAPVRYTMDPMHTYPSFQADHMGLSYWRGKFDRSHGTVVLDRAAKTGAVNVTVDVASVDFGLAKLDAWARSAQFFNAAKYPEATFRGRLEAFRNGAPTRAVGTFTLHGVTRPLTLKIERFKCIPDPIVKRRRCGADASASFQRDAYGLPAGKSFGFDMTVTLRIQVEAVADAPAATSERRPGAKR